MRRLLFVLLLCLTACPPLKNPAPVWPEYPPLAPFEGPVDAGADR